MKLRIAIWASAGALVAVFWAFYASATFPTQITAHGAGWTLISLTCPAALARHYALSFYWVLLLNAAAYGLVGLTVETIREHRKRRIDQTSN
jgi:hypothetical protein